MIDRARTLPISFDPSAPDPVDPPTVLRQAVCVRDVSWHSQASGGFEDLGFWLTFNYTGARVDECGMGSAG